MWELVLDRALRRLLKVGALTLTYPSGRVETYGDGIGTPISVALRDSSAVRRLAVNPELAFGECYTEGLLEIEDDDLRGVFRVLLSNISVGHRTPSQAVLKPFRTGLRWFHQYNPSIRSRQNVAHHYDLSGQLYDLFLDTDKQYSCAYFRTNHDTLEQAQAQKKTHIASKLLVEKGMRVLDIGCGWGGMALTLARDYGAEVLGVTLSEEQHKIASHRAVAEGLDERVTFKLMDYREVEGTFDRIVSVGMFEHVGVPHYNEYFDFVRSALSDDGIALIHTIARTGPPSYMEPWMQKYIFPGAYAPSLSEVAKPIENCNLCLLDLEVLRLHYCRTLELWLKNFEKHTKTAARIYDDSFVRMWRFYLASMAESFNTGRLLVHQYQLSKTNDAAPITRDYLYENEIGNCRMSQAAE